MRIQLTGCAVLLVLFTNAQERFGILHSNYGGSDIGLLNPARPAGQWPYADIRILGADLFAWNSLIAWSDRQSPLVGELRNGMAGNTSGNVVLRSQGLAATHRAVVQAGLSGPAFSLALGRCTIGAGIRSRVHVSATGISQELSNFIYHGLNYVPQRGERYRDAGIRAVGAAWTEFGLSYAHILHAQGFGMVSAGTNLRYALGHAAGALQLTDLDYTVVDSALLQVHEATARYGFAMPAVNAGAGLGADVGMTYERTLEEVDGYRPHKGSGGCTPARYRYRIGVSLIDLGGMRFRQGEAGAITAGAITIADHTRLPIQDVEDLDSLLATSTQWSRSKAFSIGLPTAVSVQYDQRLAENTYVAFAAVQQLAGRNAMRLRRSNSIAITPRFETRYFEASLPVVVHEYDVAHPSVGFMLRFNGLVLGSDHIMPFISRGDVYAMDVYMRLRWMIFRSPACKGRRPAKRVSGGREMIPCATPNE